MTDHLRKDNTPHKPSLWTLPVPSSISKNQEHQPDMLTETKKKTVKRTKKQSRNVFFRYNKSSIWWVNTTVWNRCVSEASVSPKLDKKNTKLLYLRKALLLLTPFNNTCIQLLEPLYRGPLHSSFAPGMRHIVRTVSVLIDQSRYTRQTQTVINTLYK